jgi:hypothetical protein
MGTLIRGAATALLALAAAALLSTAAFAADAPTPAPGPTTAPPATPAATPSPGPSTSASPSPSGSPGADCGVTNFQNCLQTSTNDVTSTIWDSMTKLVADAARNVIGGFGCELTITGSPDIPGSSTAAATPLCAGQAGGQASKALISPDLTGAYFSQYYQRSAVVAALIALGVGMAAAAFFAITRNGVRLIYAAIGYPSLVAIGIVVAPGLLNTIVRLTDDLGFYVAGPATLSNAFLNLAGIFQMPAPAGTNVGATPPPVFVIMVTSLAAVLFGLIGIIELLARSLAVYLVVLFWPLALASSAWGGGFSLARRFLRVIVAVILAKPVMVIVLSVGMGLISTSPLDLISMIEGVMLLLVSLLAPLVPFALFGGAEAAVAGQLQVRGRLEQVFGAATGSGESAPGQPAATPAPSAYRNGSGGGAALPGSAAAVAPVAGGGRGRAILRKSTDGSVEGKN